MLLWSSSAEQLSVRLWGDKKWTFGQRKLTFTSTHVLDSASKLSRGLKGSPQLHAYALDKWAAVWTNISTSVTFQRTTEWFENLRGFTSNFKSFKEEFGQLLTRKASTSNLSEADNASSSKDQFHTFLRAAPQEDLRMATLLSELSNLAYDAPAIDSSLLHTRYGLDLVASSGSGPATGRMESSSFPAPVSLGGAMSSGAKPNALPSTVGTRRTRVVTSAGSRAETNLSLGGPTSPRTVSEAAPSSLHWRGQHTRPAGATCSFEEVEVENSMEPEDEKRKGQRGTPEKPPVEWFICDEASGPTRYFVLQGSMSVDHWKINLQFDPVTFENDTTGVKVHRGIYEAAKKLYDDFLPMVRSHLRDPAARVGFTGHSLGGSIATILMLMMVHRGDLSPGVVAPVYTFGAPAVFCEGAQGGVKACHRCQLSGGCGQCGVGALGSSMSLLSRLGLPSDQVHNVVMHQDIVPRAFACDYTAVADFMKSLMPSFKDHHGLSQQLKHKLLYTFIGQVEVLQPPPSLDFVVSSEFHDMLPGRPSLYKVVTPQEQGSCDTEGPQGEENCHRGRSSWRLTLHDALLAFMNYPHPLQTLSDPGAYGPQGVISRYHNPDNYRRALAALIHLI